MNTEEKLQMHIFQEYLMLLYQMIPQSKKQIKEMLHIMNCAYLYI